MVRVTNIIFSTKCYFDFIYSKNDFAIQVNNFVYVKNNKRRNYRRKFYFNKNKKYVIKIMVDIEINQIIIMMVI